MLWFFKIFSPKNLAKKLAFFVQTTASFCKNCGHDIGFWEKRQFFRRKLSKIAENCDHNIDPRSRMKARQFFNGECILKSPNFFSQTNPSIKVLIIQMKKMTFQNSSIDKSPSVTTTLAHAVHSAKLFWMRWNRICSKKNYHNNGFSRKPPTFSQKMVKTAENSDLYCNV
jgi:hypothetical protein